MLRIRHCRALTRALCSSFLCDQSSLLLSRSSSLYSSVLRHLLPNGTESITSGDGSSVEALDGAGALRGPGDDYAFQCSCNLMDWVRSVVCQQRVCVGYGLSKQHIVGL